MERGVDSCEQDAWQFLVHSPKWSYAPIGGNCQDSVRTRRLHERPAQVLLFERIPGVYESSLLQYRADVLPFLSDVLESP